MLNVGILGCGKMGKVYARWFDENENTKVSAVYNRTYETAQNLACEYKGCVAVEDWKSIIRDKNIDIIGICTPSSEHCEQVLECIHEKKHVLLEKPVTGNVEEALKIEKALSNSDIKMLIGFQMRFHPVIMKVSELVKKAGRIMSVDFYFGMYRPEVTWRHQLSQGGGVFKELGSHLVDLASMWLGTPQYIKSVNRVFQKDREVEDFCQTLIEYESGGIGSFSCNYWDRDSRAIKGKILAENYQINFSFSSYSPEDSRIVLIDDNGRHNIALPKLSNSEIDSIYPGHLDSFRKEIIFFVEAIQNNLDIGYSIKNGVQSMEITDGAYESQRQNIAIKYPCSQFNKSLLSECFIKSF